MKMRDVWICAEEWAGVRVVIAEQERFVEGMPREFGVHVMFDDGSHGLQFADGESEDEALEKLAVRWERLAAEVRALKERRRVVVDTQEEE